jgi:hypothetical protein
MAWTSPRTTQLLHQGGDLFSLPYVCRVIREPPCLGGEAGAPSLALGRFGDGLPRCLRARHSAAPGDLVERL